MAKKRKTAGAASSSKQQEPLINITEEEQWRIIRDSGILHKIKKTDGDSESEVAEGEPLLSPLTEEIFSAMTLIIPHSFLLLMMEILIHYQYGRRPTYKALFDRMITGVPILAIFIFYTCRYRHRRPVQAFLFVLALICGGRLIWLINFENWRSVMKLSPPLATMWVYTIVRLDLAPATLSLIIVGLWVRYKHLRLVLT
ncbi:hypothetical protein NM688_g90 [Phlebia brevispora]|uniref:Uncharacterized protein n=1 Tax=Phlebia brevispora TaxID=194682 RepID=A0ACC1TFG1_9APHY|nr:hypothetical protein NM688_g90 [Phlebia brevispora]